MPSKKLTPPDAGIDNLIREIRGVRVILDSDLAALYGVTTKRLNEQFRGNRSRFPSDFAFQPTAEEAGNWSQFATSSSKHRGRFAGKAHGPRSQVELGNYTLPRSASAPCSRKYSEFDLPAIRLENSAVAG